MQIYLEVELGNLVRALVCKYHYNKCCLHELLSYKRYIRLSRRVAFKKIIHYLCEKTVWLNFITNIIYWLILVLKVDFLLNSEHIWFPYPLLRRMWVNKWKHWTYRAVRDWQVFIACAARKRPNGQGINNNFFFFFNEIKLWNL